MNTIARIALESWIGQERHVTELEQPSEADLRNFFGKLNGRTDDTLAIEAAGGGSLLLGGGPGKFVAVCFEPGGAAYHAQRRTNEQGAERIQIGGQVGDYPRSYVLERDAAWHIAVAYLTERARWPEVNWVQDVAA